MSALEDDVRSVLRDFKFKGNRGYATRLNHIISGTSATVTIRGANASAVTSEQVPEDPSEALISAVIDNDLYRVKKAIKNGADLRYRCASCHQTALIIATETGYFRIIDYLLQAGSDIWQEDDNWRSAWYFAFFGSGLSLTNSNLATVERFLEHTADERNPPSATTMLMAAYASTTQGLATAVLEQLPFTILSRDSNHRAKVSASRGPPFVFVT
jgi:hypothetical protein